MSDEDYVAELRSYGMLSTNQAAARIEALAAERDWLRAALKAIVVGVDEDFDEATQQNVTTWFSDQDMQDIARTALKGESHE